MKTRDVLAMCYGKHPFPTYAAASMVAQSSSANHSAPIMPYRCEHCGKYHVGERRGGREKDVKNFRKRRDERRRQMEEA